MAQKPYSIDFVLNAVLNGGFSGVFSKAQQEFLRLGAEIKNLQAIQRDITAYEKQGAAVQNTTAKLENLRRQYELVNRQIQEATGSTTGLEREKLKLEQRITNTQAALEKQQSKLGGTKTRLDAAGVSTENLSAKSAELSQKIGQLSEEQRQAAESAAKFGTTGAEAFESVGNALVAAGIINGLGQVKDAFVETVQVAADFEEQMSAVEAIASANRSQMEALSAEAKELGATTIYTAYQSAEGMKYMAMAGWTAEDMLSGMRGMTTLAAAAGEDLGMVSDMVTDNLTAFGLKASDTAHFADVLAQAANRSNTDIAIMGDTFKYSAAVAGALGYSIEDVATMVGLMANNGVKGSRAGTALRNIFNGLLGDITLTSKAFGEVEYSAINADGTMKGLAETVKDLRYYFSQMTESEQVNNALNIANMRGYNGLLAIVNSTEEDFNSLYDSINNCEGAAERMAQVKLDNLNGDVTLMNSAMEALQSTIGEQFNPELRELAQLGTEGINWMNQMIQDNPELTKGIMAGAGAFGTMATAIVGASAAVKIFQKLNLASLFTGIPGILLGVAAGIGAVTTVGVALFDHFRDGGPAVRELTEAARDLNAAMAESRETMDGAMASAEASAEMADMYIDRLERMGDTAAMNEEQQREYQITLASLLQVMPSLSKQISSTEDQYGRMTYTLNTNTDALRANVDAWKESAKEQAYQEYINTMTEKYNAVMTERWENEIALAMATDRRTEAQKKLEAVLKQVNFLTEEAGKEENAYNPNVVEAYEKEIYELRIQASDLETEIRNLNDDIQAHETAIEKDATAVEEANAAIDYAVDRHDELIDILNGSTDAQEANAEAQRDLQTVLNDTSNSLEMLASQYDEAYAAAKESIEGQFGLFDEAKADAEATVAAAQKAADSQLSYWTSYAQNIATLKELSAEDLNITQQNYELLMNYVREGTPEAAGLAQSLVNNVKKGNTQALTELANTLGEIHAQQEAAESDIAEWTIGLKEQVDQLVEDVEEDIGNLDFANEAKQAAMSTIQAYITQAQYMEDAVARAYQRVADAAMKALGVNTTSAASGGHGPLVSVQTSTSSVLRPDLTHGDSLYESLYGNIMHNAGGTHNAPPGWSWVGEEGPELIRLRGGEEILPAEVSRTVAAEYDAYRRYAGADSHETSHTVMRGAALPDVERIWRDNEVTASGLPGLGGIGKIELNFNIAAGASPETVRAWQDYADRGELRETILEILEDVETDARRRAIT